MKPIAASCIARVSDQNYIRYKICIVNPKTSNLIEISSAVSEQERADAEEGSLEEFVKDSL
jgi:hypothetical protein